MLNLASRMVCRTRVYPSRLAGHNTSYIRLFSLSVRTQPVQFRSISAAGRRRVSLLTLFQTGFKPYFKHRLQGSVLQPVPWCFPIEGRSSSALSALHYDNAHLHSRRFGSGPWENDDDGQAPGCACSSNSLTQKCRCSFSLSSSNVEASPEEARWRWLYVSFRYQSASPFNAFKEFYVCHHMPHCVDAML